jgi:mRNA-degrading endonuclease RelE of RelBE toxin-antitoxin system
MVEPIIQELQSGSFIGDRIQGLGNVVVFKVRAPNSDAQRGKSGGYSLIYELRSSDLVVLLQIYSKSEREDINADEIRSILTQFDE